jgi:hypothetical protein
LAIKHHLALPSGCGKSIVAAKDVCFSRLTHQELVILADTAMRKSVASHGIRLINYSQIAN